MSLLKSMDFPTLGRPTIATKGLAMENTSFHLVLRDNIIPQFDISVNLGVQTVHCDFPPPALTWPQIAAMMSLSSSFPKPGRVFVQKDRPYTFD